jgi:serine/threonine protein kinase
MGAVYLAEQSSLGRQVAIKVMTRPGNGGGDTRAKRFMREAKAAASLRHPNIISVYDVGEVDGQLYMVMDYVRGVALRKLILDGLSHGSVNKISSDLCRALQAAHHAGFVHRDIKPENVLIGTDGNAVLTDFGVVKLTGQQDQTRLTRTGITLGSLAYMSPEQCQAKNLDHRSDLYSVGCLMFEMLEGQPPFQGNNPVAVATQHLGSVPPALSERNAQYSKLVAKLLAKRPSQRVQTARDVLVALKRIGKFQARAC